MSQSIKRRSFLKGSLAATTAIAIPMQAIAADKVKMGVLLPSPEADVGWSRTLMDGVRSVQEAYGDALEVTVLENIAEGPDADRIPTGWLAKAMMFFCLALFDIRMEAFKLPSAAVMFRSFMPLVSWLNLILRHSPRNIGKGHI